MTAIFLFDLYPQLLLEVLKKFRIKAYFRLQQTCRTAPEIIRSYRDISIRFNTNLRVAKRGASFIIFGGRVYTELSCLYGMWLRELTICYDQSRCSQGFSNLCGALKTHKIKCKKLIIGHFIDNDLTKKDCLSLLKILKPVEVKISSTGSNSVEALFGIEQLKRVEVSLDPETIDDVGRKLLHRFQEVSITTSDRTDALGMIHSFLQTLQSESPSNLSKLHFCVSTRELRTEEELMELFHDFTLTVVDSDKRQATVSVAMPRPFHNGYSCKLIIDGSFYSGVHLHYNR